MPLPKIQHPTFETELPSNKQKVKYRQFTVKEHRLLMTANEFADPTNLSETFRSIIQNCTFDLVDIDNLPMFDVDWLYMTIRSAAAGGIVKVTYTCNGQTEAGRCGNQLNLALDTHVKVTNDIGIKLRYPTFDDYAKKYGMGDLQKLKEELILDCVELVYDKDEVSYANKDFTRQELADFLDTLDEVSSNKIVHFVNNIPDIQMDVPIRCSKCGNQTELHLKGLNDFLE